VSEENKTIVLASTEALNARDLSMWSQKRADDFTAEYPGLLVLNKTQSKMFNQSFVTALPDIHFHTEHVLAEDDFVLIHWTASGTHTERLAVVSGETIPPTGRRVTIASVLLAEVRDGKIKR
jgi:predicted ester cyclase